MTWCNDNWTAEWTLVQMPGIPYYWIESRVNGSRPMSVPNFGVNNGDPVQNIDWKGTADQEWQINYVFNFTARLSAPPGGDDSRARSQAEATRHGQ
jgi:hypothetical protein